MKKKLIYNPTYLILSLIAVNIISYFLFIRIDLTSNKKYSLSPVSKTMIKKIDKDISVTLFMSEGLTPDKIKLGREFRHLLKEYKTISNKAFTISTIIPNNSDKEALAEQLGIEPMLWSRHPDWQQKRDTKYSPDHSIRIRGYPPFKRSLRHDQTDYRFLTWT